MAYDTIGSIVILKFQEKKTKKEKLIVARKILEEHKNIKTILEKIEKVSGKLGVLKVKYLAGKKTTETIHKESGCIFKLDVAKCYFSPRLSNDRLEIAKRIKQGKVLCLFSGLAPYPIIIAKKTSASKIIAIELNKFCQHYAKENKILNKIGDKLELIQGDVRKVIPKLKENRKILEKLEILGPRKSGDFRGFDYIVMTRPQLKDTFLKAALKASKKGTIIFYHGFAKNIEEIKKEILKDVKKSRKKIKFLEYWKNGDISPYKHRFTVVFKIK